MQLEDFARFMDNVISHKEPREAFNYFGIMQQEDEFADVKFDIPKMKIKVKRINEYDEAE